MEGKNFGRLLGEMGTGEACANEMKETEQVRMPNDFAL